MKVRTSFVSNSSSSSYIIALKKPMKKIEVIEMIMQYFSVSPDSYFWSIAKDVAEYFTCDLFHHETIEELEEEYGLNDDVKEKLKDFKHFYHGDMNNYDGGFGEFILDNIAIHIDNEDMYMCFDGMF